MTKNDLTVLINRLDADDEEFPYSLWYLKTSNLYHGTEVFDTVHLLATSGILLLYRLFDTVEDKLERINWVESESLAERIDVYTLILDGSRTFQLHRNEAIPLDSDSGEAKKRLFKLTETKKIKRKE